MIRKIICIALIFCFGFQQVGFAQLAPQLGVPAYLNNLTVPDRFRPVHLRAVTFDPAMENFTWFLDQGDSKKITREKYEQISGELRAYFQIGMVLPNEMFWVNLRPDEEKNIIDPLLEKTDLGRIMLAADLNLKKDMARLTSPKTAEGRQYWDKLYARAEQLYGNEDIVVPTMTRPWIVPGEIILREGEGSVFVYKALLKVMLEEDYVKGSECDLNDARLKELNDYSSALIRELILPKLTRMVNGSKRYSQLRQVYYSLVLAQWFKRTHSNTGMNIDSGNIAGLTSKKAWSKSTYFRAYQKSFSKGEYRMEETVRGTEGLTFRQYVSGGIVMPHAAPSFVTKTGFDGGRLPEGLKTEVVTVNGEGKIEAADGGAEEDFNGALTRLNARERQQRIENSEIVNTLMSVLNQYPQADPRILLRSTVSFKTNTLSALVSVGAAIFAGLLAGFLFGEIAAGFVAPMVLFFTFMSNLYSKLLPYLDWDVAFRNYALKILRESQEYTTWEGNRNAQKTLDSFDGGQKLTNGEVASALTMGAVVTAGMGIGMFLLSSVFFMANQDFSAISMVGGVNMILAAMTMAIAAKNQNRQSREQFSRTEFAEAMSTGAKITLPVSIGMLLLSHVFQQLGYIFQEYDVGSSGFMFTAGDSFVISAIGIFAAGLVMATTYSSFKEQAQGKEQNDGGEADAGTVFNRALAKLNSLERERQQRIENSEIVNTLMSVLNQYPQADPRILFRNIDRNNVAFRKYLHILRGSEEYKNLVRNRFSNINGKEAYLTLLGTLRAVNHTIVTPYALGSDPTIADFRQLVRGIKDPVILVRVINILADDLRMSDAIARNLSRSQRNELIVMDIEKEIVKALRAGVSESQLRIVVQELVRKTGLGAQRQKQVLELVEEKVRESANSFTVSAAQAAQIGFAACCAIALSNLAILFHGDMVSDAVGVTDMPVALGDFIGDQNVRAIDSTFEELQSSVTGGIKAADSAALSALNMGVAAGEIKSLTGQHFGPGSSWIDIKPTNLTEHVVEVTMYSPVDGATAQIQVLDKNVRPGTFPFDTLHRIVLKKGWHTYKATARDFTGNTHGIVHVAVHYGTSSIISQMKNGMDEKVQAGQIEIREKGFLDDIIDILPSNLRSLFMVAAGAIAAADSAAASALNMGVTAADVKPLKPAYETRTESTVEGTKYYLEAKESVDLTNKVIRIEARGHAGDGLGIMVTDGNRKEFVFKQPLTEGNNEIEITAADLHKVDTRHIKLVEVQGFGMDNYAVVFSIDVAGNGLPQYGAGSTWIDIGPTDLTKSVVEVTLYSPVDGALAELQVLDENGNPGTFPASTLHQIGLKEGWHTYKATARDFTGNAVDTQRIVHVAVHFGTSSIIPQMKNGLDDKVQAAGIKIRDKGILDDLIDILPENLRSIFMVAVGAVASGITAADSAAISALNMGVTAADIEPLAEQAPVSFNFRNFHGFAEIVPNRTISFTDNDIIQVELNGRADHAVTVTVRDERVARANSSKKFYLNKHGKNYLWLSREDFSGIESIADITVSDNNSGAESEVLSVELMQADGVVDNVESVVNLSERNTALSIRKGLHYWNIKPSRPLVFGENDVIELEVIGYDKRDLAITMHDPEMDEGMELQSMKTFDLTRDGRNIIRLTKKDFPLVNSIDYILINDMWEDSIGLKVRLIEGESTPTMVPAIGESTKEVAPLIRIYYGLIQWIADVRKQVDDLFAYSFTEKPAENRMPIEVRMNRSTITVGDVSKAYLDRGTGIIYYEIYWTGELRKAEPGVGDPMYDVVLDAMRSNVNELIESPRVWETDRLDLKGVLRELEKYSNDLVNMQEKPDGAKRLPITVRMNSSTITVGDVSNAYLDRKTGEIRYEIYWTSETRTAKPGTNDPMYEGVLASMRKNVAELQTKKDLNRKQAKDLETVLRELERYGENEKKRGIEDNLFSAAKSALDIRTAAADIEPPPDEQTVTTVEEKRASEGESIGFIQGIIREIQKFIESIALPKKGESEVSIEMNPSEYRAGGKDILITVKMNSSTITVGDVSKAYLDRGTGIIYYEVYWTGELRKAEPGMGDPMYDVLLGQMRGNIAELQAARLMEGSIRYELNRVMAELDKYSNDLIRIKATPAGEKRIPIEARMNISTIIIGDVSNAYLDRKTGVINYEVYYSGETRKAEPGTGDTMYDTVLSHMHSNIRDMQTAEGLSPEQKQGLDTIMQELNKYGTNDQTMKEEVSAQKDGGSTVGGIDFRSLPAATSGFTAAEVPLIYVPLEQLQQQWSGIREKLQKGQMPYQDMKMFLRAGGNSEETKTQRQELCRILLNILKMEEDRAVESSPDMKEVLACIG